MYCCSRPVGAFRFFLGGNLSDLVRPRLFLGCLSGPSCTTVVHSPVVTTLLSCCRGPHFFREDASEETMGGGVRGRVFCVQIGLDEICGLFFFASPTSMAKAGHKKCPPCIVETDQLKSSCARFRPPNRRSSISFTSSPTVVPHG